MFSPFSAFVQWETTFLTSCLLLCTTRSFKNRVFLKYEILSFNSLTTKEETTKYSSANFEQKC